MRPNERLDSTTKRSGERLDLTGEVTVSFFNELDTRKEICSRLWVQSLDFVSFFNEISTERKTMLITSVSFFNELSTEKRKLCSLASVSFFQILP
jgi:hypothetical protein